ncbi:MAG: hypothetical protein ACOC1O_00800 [bacterium]
MRKVFQIGFHICGTRSLAHFFRINNFKSFHYEKTLLAEQLFRNLDREKGITKFDPNFEGPFPGKQGIFYSDMQKSVHDKKEREKLGNGNKFFKWEGYKLFRELDKSYPGSLFILNLRDGWIDRKIRGDKHKDKPGLYTTQELREYLEHEWKTHINNVRDYFKNRDGLIEFHIQKDPIDKLVNWLEYHGFKIYKREFPKIRG